MRNHLIRRFFYSKVKFGRFYSFNPKNRGRLHQAIYIYTAEVTGHKGEITFAGYKEIKLLTIESTLVSKLLCRFRIQAKLAWRDYFTKSNKH